MGNLSMKRIYKISIIGIAFILSQSAFATGNEPKDGKKVSGLKVGSEFISGSTGVSQYMLNRIALGGYMKNDRIAIADENMNKNSHAGMLFNFGVHLWFDSVTKQGKYIDKFHIYKIGLQYNNVAGVAFSQGAFRAIFLGNSPYKGQQLDVDIALNQFTTRGISAGWMMKRKQGVFKLGLGLEQLIAYRNLELNNSYIKTDSNATNVDVLLNGKFYNSANSKKGFGMITDLEWHFNKTNKPVKMLKMGVHRLGFYYAMAGNEYSLKMDSAANITQQEIQLKVLNTSAWVTQQRDTFTRALSPDSAFISKKLILSPFQLFANLQIKNLQFNFRYIYITGFLPSLTLMRANPWNYKNVKIQPSLQLGGFDTYNLNLSLGGAIKCKGKVGMDWMLQFNGIESMILPVRTHGAGAMASLKFHYLK